FELAEKELAGLHEQLNIQSTPFVGYDSLTHQTEVIGILTENKLQESVAEGAETGLILATTPCYGEMGGQVGDSGQIDGESGGFAVTGTVRLPPDIIVHQGRITSGSLSVGDKVTVRVDEEQRRDIARNHTATHLLHYALRQVLGESAQQRGSLVAPDRLRFDFSHLVAPTRQELTEIQHIVNEKIRQNMAVYGEETTYQKAIAEGAIALFDEKYADTVRVLKIGKQAASAELCGGTHVKATGEIGIFHIVSEGSIGSGLRRIEAVTGGEAEAFIERHFATLGDIAQSLGATLENVGEKVLSTIRAYETERRRALALERELARSSIDSLLGQVEVVKGVNVLAAHVPDSRIDVLREMSDLLRHKLKSAVVVLGTVCDNKPLLLAAVTPDLVARGYNAGEIIRPVAKMTGGGGGGKPDLAQAGGKDKDKLDEALQLVKSLI
ncbi:DHHA1 domain-containing protein, partial [Chloroflexota bacterium]